MKSMLAGMILAVAAAVAMAQDKADAGKWIKELGSESFDAREKATAELKKIGAPALEALKKAAIESPDAEVRARADEIVRDIEKAAKPEARKPKVVVPAVPGVPGRGASVTVQQVNGDSTYTITPADGTPFTFRKSAAGAVQLDYTDGQGKEQSVKSDSLDAFLKDHKELAGSFGISKDGIDHGGAKIDFNGNPVRAFQRWRVVPFRGFGQNEDDEEDEEDLLNRWGAFALGQPAMKASGATLEAVTDVLRAQLEIAEGQGLVVTRVGEDTIAARAGLKRHDILLEIDGTKVAAAKDVKSLLKKESKCLVIRAGKRLTTGEK